MMRKRLAILGLSCVFVLSFVFGIGFLPSVKQAAAETVTYDTATVYDLYELTNEKSFTSNTRETRNIGQMPDTHNVAIKAKLSYDSTSTKILIINFLMGHKNTVNSQYFLQDCGYMFYFRDNTARLVYQGDGTETNQLANTAVSLGWSELSAKLATIDNLDGSGKINAEEWRYGREPFLFEMGYVKAYTDGEWTGNYVYVKINDVELMSFTDTGAHYQDKGTYFGKGATGYDYTYYTFGTSYSFANIVMENAPIGADFEANDTVEVVVAPNAVLKIPTKSGYAVGTVSLDGVDVSDKLTWIPSAGVVDCSGLAEGTYKATVTMVEAVTEQVTVYDLYDLKGVKEHSPTTANDETQNIGKFDANNNVAFRGKISYPDAESKNHNIIVNHLILKSTADSHFANGGYGYQLLLKDKELFIRYDTDPTTANDSSEIAVGAKLTAEALATALTESVGLTADEAVAFSQGKVEFTLEFGCAKYIVNDAWVANYVYAKINDVEVLHFIDNGANYKNADALGEYTGRGAFGREWSPYKYSTAYGTVVITIEDIPDGANFVDNRFEVFAASASQLLLPLKFGYVLESATLNGEDAMNLITESDGKYLLDCSALTSDATLKITTALGKATITVIENGYVTVTAQSQCDLTSTFSVKLTTETGYTLSSLKINGEELIEQVRLGNDGVYTIGGYQVLEDLRLETQVQETCYSITIKVTGDGRVVAPTGADAFDKAIVTFTPFEGAYVKKVTLNGETILLNGNGEYVVEKVMEDLIFEVAFSEVPTAESDTSDSSNSDAIGFVGCNAVVGSDSMTFAGLVLALSTFIAIKRKKD